MSNTKNLELSVSESLMSESMIPSLERLEESEPLILKKQKKRFRDNVIHTSVVACNNIRSGFDLDQARYDVEAGLSAIELKSGLQTMLAAQMLSVHELQQTSMAMANNVSHPESLQYYTNTAIKLGNLFVQQATLLAKLQGNGGQKLTVEHVEVHNGGQAFVGTVEGATPSEVRKK